MKDLTRDSIAQHLLRLSGPIAAGMLSQIACQLINLYFVSRVGAAAVAGVNIAANAILIVSALTQVLSVGTATLVAHATGGKNQHGAMLAFNQALGLALFCAIAAVTCLGALASPYMRSMSADFAIANAGTTFIYAMLPGLVLTFPMTTLGAALRGSGVVRPTVLVQGITVLLNAAFAPMLIAGWGTGVALGVAGAGLATSISVAFGVVLLAAYFHRVERYVALRSALLRPRWSEWRHILSIGLPTAGEFTLIFLATAVAYYAIRNFGVAAQAGLAVGSRVVQAILLPGMAIAFAVGPIAGQNCGARESGRLRETLHTALLMETVAMLATAGVLNWQSAALVEVFASDPVTIGVAVLFLQLRSWDFVAQGVVYTCSNMFQGLGNTRPALISSGMRFATFSLATLWLAQQPSFRIAHVWYAWISSVALQAIVSALLLRREMKRALQLPCKTAAAPPS